MLIPLLLLLCGCNTDGPVSSVVRNNEADIRSLCPVLDQALNSGDVDKMMQFYAPGAVRMDPHTEPAYGIEEIRSHFVTLVQSTNIYIQRKVSDVRIASHLAIARGTWTASHTLSGQVIRDKGTWLSTYILQPDDTWKILWEISNSDLSLRQIDSL